MNKKKFRIETHERFPFMFGLGCSVLTFVVGLTWPSSLSLCVIVAIMVFIGATFLGFFINPYV